MHHHCCALKHGEAGPPLFVAPDELILPSRAELTEPVRSVVTWSFLPAERGREELVALRGLTMPLEQMAQASLGEESLLPRRSGLPGQRATAVRHRHHCKCTSEHRGP
jgi:hypothetical protein